MALSKPTRQGSLSDLIHLAVDTAADPIVLCDAGGALLYANAAACRFYGYPARELTRLTIHDLDPDFSPDTWPQHWESLKRQGSLCVHVRHTLRSGEVRDVEVVDTYTAVDGQEFSTLVLRDLAAREASHSRMKLMEFSIDQMSDSAFWLDREGRILFANDAATRNLGYARDKLLGMNIAEIAVGLDQAGWKERWDHLRDQKVRIVETEYRHADGRTIPVEVSVSYVRIDQREFHCALARDISQRRETERRLLHLANYDQLTGLANRHLLEEDLARELARSKRTDRNFALMMIGLDRFKLVNDSFGHGAGDKVLCQIAERLQRTVRDTDTVARIGGDLFVILLPELVRGEDTARVAQQVMEEVSHPFTLESGNVNLTASVGVAVFPRDGETAEILAKNADISLYRAKEFGGNCFQFFSQELGDRVRTRVQVQSGIRGALANGEFLLHYQPFVDLRSGRIVGAEGLIRWQHPESGLVPPAQFIPVAEESGLIGEIGDWVLEEACRSLVRWRDLGARSIPLSVNLSPRQISVGLVAQVGSLLDRYRINPLHLALELTETSVMKQAAGISEIFSGVRDLGVSFAIDDFGTGYSSLSYLRRFPVQTLKIDRSFVQEVEVNAEDAVLTRTIIDMGHNLGFKVLAEGVESAEQLAFLRQAGCDKAQGFYFSRPLPEAEFISLLEADRPLP